MTVSPRFREDSEGRPSLPAPSLTEPLGLALKAAQGAKLLSRYTVWGLRGWPSRSVGSSETLT